MYGFWNKEIIMPYDCTENNNFYWKISNQFTSRNQKNDMNLWSPSPFPDASTTLIEILSTENSCLWLDFSILSVVAGIKDLKPSNKKDQTTDWLQKMVGCIFK